MATCRKSHWRGIAISRAGRLFFYESSAFRDAANAGKARRARSVFCRIVFRAEPVRRTCGHEDRDAVSQETCHPSGHSAQGEMLPDASTEVVVAHRSSIERVFGVRRCRYSHRYGKR
ncbi:hypothetical protein SM0020_17927 [Sinorhizobium meliloti CCNWSX0020]|uniref:Uncharacterized protein n=1 Tax=Sinorhizobium meliloti CCNWSX0020 TaxID=1107881 RepID=H0G295_RHIML|nr:hypothetical protein SM0020_17927 [Sinorhizobium meliloti CCNWSX0020]